MNTPPREVNTEINTALQEDRVQEVLFRLTLCIHYTCLLLRDRCFLKGHASVINLGKDNTYVNSRGEAN